MCICNAEACFSGRLDAHLQPRQTSRTYLRLQTVHERASSTGFKEGSEAVLSIFEGATPYQQLSQKSRSYTSPQVDLGPNLLQGCEPSAQAPLKVAVLLSGGVDSSLALHLLKRAGHDVTAFYLQIWFQEDFKNFWDACPWEEDLEFCKRVCQAEDIPLEIVPFTQQYWDRVVEDSILEIKRGHTPNPDILCNSRIKFGAFSEFLEAQYGSAYDRIASGHYAAVLRPKHAHDAIQLSLSPDTLKDQTYFLAHLTQHQLSKCLFPLGHLTKMEVRHLALKAELPTQARKDSQGICFLGKVRFDDFVRQHLGTWPGPLVDDESDQVVGFHEGYWFYTPGQRKGIMLSGGPWYVARKDCRKNVVYISRQYYSSERQRRKFTCGDFNWFGQAPRSSKGLKCKTRHGPRIHNCTLSFDGPKAKTATVILEEDDQGLAPGQYAVFYQANICLGSGVILDSVQPLVQSTGL